MTNRIEQIEKYIEGHLNGEELQAFETRMQEDSAFAAEVASTKLMLEELKVYGKRKELKQELDTMHSEMLVEKVKPVTKVVNIKSYYSTMAVAASIALVTSICTFLSINYWNNSHANRVSYRELKMAVDQMKISHNKMWRQIYNDKKIVNPGNFSGTGFAISSQGYLATSYHLVKDADSVFIENDKFSRLKVKTIFTDKSRDIAILKVIESDFKTFGQLPYGFNAHDKELGDRIFTLGFPREDIVYGEGYISSSTGFNEDTSAYQVSIPVNPGNSGGPILDEYGNIVGVVSGKHTENEGTAFALKTFYLQNSIEKLEKDSLNIHLSLYMKHQSNSLKRTEMVRKTQNLVFRVRVYK